ncbi:MAG TPA: mercury(II) reductase [Ktedonobacterales bacterium]
MAQNPEHQSDVYDLVILGSGSTAFAAALRAAELGKRALMIEERTLGGTCANRGCLPSKHLIDAARLLHDARHPRYPGITPYEPIFSFAELIERKDALIADYRQAKYADVAAAASVEIAQGHAEFVSAHEVRVGERVVRGEHFLIATGSRPFIPDLDGLADVPYLTSDLLTSGEAMELRETPRSLVILGGGYIALELGQMFRRFGAEVTIVTSGSRALGKHAEPEVGNAIQSILREEGIKIITHAQARGVRMDAGGVAVTYALHGEPHVARGERLLIATGRRPNSDIQGLERAGVRVGVDGAVVVDEYLRTSAPHIWAAGDVIGDAHGNQQATPVGARDGAIVAHNALSGMQPRRVDHRVIPRAVFTDPQVASVGLTHAQATASGIACWCDTVPLTYVPRAGATLDTRGLVKLVANARTREVLGASMVGANAAEVIHEAAMGMRFHATLDDFIDLLHVYPTMAEALKIAAISYYKDPAHLSCCAD